MQKAIIFDLDGTLLDTLEDIALSANYALSTLGFETQEIVKYRYFVGEGVIKLFENIFASNPQTPMLIAEAVKLFEEHYRTQFYQNTKPYEGIAKMLTFLQKKGFKMAILSNKPDSFTKMCALRYFRKWHFEVVYGAREGVPRKPDPTGALDIAEVLGMDPKACYFLGDTCIDMQTANRANMMALGAVWGFREEKELKENGALHTMQHPFDVIKFFS